MYFPHVDVSIPYWDYYILFHFNKSQIDGHDGSAFDENYVRIILTSIFTSTEILTLDFPYKKLEFARGMHIIPFTID